MAHSYAHVVCGLSDRDLMRRLREVARGGQENTAELLFHLREIDTRNLCAREADGSTFMYCVNVLHFSESEAFKRIGAARAAKQFPEILDMVARGELHLTAVNLLASHLTVENHRELLAAAVHKTKREIQEVLAAWFPEPDAKTVLRKLPEPASARRADAGPGLFDARTSTPAGLMQATTGGPTAASASATSPSEVSAAASSAVGSSASSAGRSASPGAFGRPPDRGSVAPLSPGRYRLQVTLSRETRDKLVHAQDLMRHIQPDGDLAVVLDRAVTCLVEQLENRKLGKCKRPRRDKAREQAAMSAQAVPEAVEQGKPWAVAVATAQVVPEAVEQVKPPAATVATTQVVPEAVEQVKSSAAAVGTARVVPEAVLTTAGVGARCGARTKKRSRDVSRAVRRAVEARDGGQCTFVGPDGRRCQERGFLQFHHREPRARGGEATVANITTLCFIHNIEQAVIDFGAEAVRRGGGRRGSGEAATSGAGGGDRGRRRRRR